MIELSSISSTAHPSSASKNCEVRTDRHDWMSGARLLIVEDDFALADDLRNNFEDAGMDVLEPVPTLEAGHAALAMRQPDVAVLDIDLRGRPVYSLADALIRRGVFVVFYTGYDRALLPKHLQYLPCITKPAGAEVIIDAFKHMSPAEHTRGSIISLLPDLRLLAASITGEVAAGDRLVEAALEQAIASIAQRPHDASLEVWLRELVRSAASRAGYQRLH